MFIDVGSLINNSNNFNTVRVGNLRKWLALILIEIFPNINDQLGKIKSLGLHFIASCIMRYFCES